MLTKKYYEMIAEAVLNSAPKGELNRNAAVIYRYDIATGLADRFAADNPRFNRARFLKACGVAS